MLVAREELDPPESKMQGKERAQTHTRRQPASRPAKVNLDFVRNTAISLMRSRGILKLTEPSALLINSHAVPIAVPCSCTVGYTDVHERN